MTDKRLSALKETWSRLDEDKTPQEIGYHLTDYKGYKGVLATNGLLANPKEKKFDEQARLLKKQQKASQAVAPLAPEQEPTNAG